ncbi:MAG: DUF3667 domain-containing protein [Burkholderiaceae bacterium]
MPARFCVHCGQRTDTKRLTLRDIWRELMHAFANVERSPLALLRALLTRPGGLARDYVDGKRRRHHGPFATLTLLVGITTLVINVMGFQVLAHDRFAADATDLLQHNFNLLLLVQLPLLGVICAWLFRAARLTLAEHMVLVAYTLSLRAIPPMLAALLQWLRSAPAAPTLGMVVAFWVAWYVYFGWAASQFYPGPRLVNALKGGLAAAVGHAAILLLVDAGSFVHGWIVRLAGGA